MPFLTPAELNSHIYPEVVKQIEREDDLTPLLQTAIDAALAEVSSYLSQYDQAAIFGATGAERNAIILLYSKDIAIWHYIQLANINIDLELREKRYKTATEWLGKVQSGKVAPSLPVVIIGGGTGSGGGSTSGSGNYIKYGSNPKRTQHF